MNSAITAALASAVEAMAMMSKSGAKELIGKSRDHHAKEPEVRP